MRHRPNRVLPALLGWLALAVPAWSGTGTAGGALLQQPLSPRPAGGAGAYTAYQGDLQTLGLNPAGLALMASPELSLLHAGGLDGLSTEVLLAAMPIPELGVAGFEILYRSQPPIDNQVAGEAPVDVRDLLVGVTVAGSPAPDWTLGVTGKALISTLASSDASALMVDLGAQWKASDTVHLGAAVRHVGENLKFRNTGDPLPLTLAAGGRFGLLVLGAHEWSAETDLEAVVPEENGVLRVGTEYRFRGVLIARAGYVVSRKELARGITLGLGYRVRLGGLQMQIDYALVPETRAEDSFSAENLISLALIF